MFVFVSSRYGDKDESMRAENARYAARMCKYIIDESPREIPLAPHIMCTQWWNDDNNRSESIQLCKEMMRKCEKLYVCGDYMPTAGMRSEIAEAVHLNIPIKYINFTMMRDTNMEPDLKLVPNG